MFKQSVGKTSVSVLDAFIPFVIISKVALAKMKLYVDGCVDEIGWLGTATKNDENIFFINDMFLFEQDVHSTTTEITPEGLADFAEELLQQPNGIDIWNNLRVWGHSHVNMGTSPSSQDNIQMEAFADGGHPWFIRIIANKKSEITIDLYDFSQGIVYTNLKWWEECTDLEKDIENHIKELQAQLSSIKNTYMDEYKPLIDLEIKSKVSAKVAGYIGRYVPKSYNANDVIVTDNLSDNWYSKSDDGTIKNFKDVYELIDEIFLLEIAQCYTFLQAKQTITLLVGDYDYSEIYVIWNAAKEKYGSKVG